jgi:hypothetical protein
MNRSNRIGAAGIFAVLCCVSFPAAGDATGTMRIQHAGGTVNTYSDVEVKIFSGALFLTSDDGDGTIVVTKAACSYQGKVIICLPITAALVQDGKSNALDLRSGTIYLNYTNAAQPLSRTSAKLPANSVMLTLTTRNNTFITVHGRIDQVIRQ